MRLTRFLIKRYLENLVLNLPMILKQKTNVNLVTQVK